MLKPGLGGADMLRQGEGADLLADNLRMKKRLGFDGHESRTR